MMQMKTNVIIFHKALTCFVAVCLVIGLLPLASVPASAATFWEGWQALPTTAGTTLGSNGTTTNYRVNASSGTTVNISATTAGANGLAVAVGATVVIYIPEGVTLNVIAATTSRTGTAGGGAGILLPSTSTLIIRGEGTLSATGGRGGNGTNGGNAVGNAYGHLGNGGNGGGGGGAGIGTYGGNGGNGVLEGERGAGIYKNGDDGSGSGAMGALYVLDTVNVTGIGGSSGSVGNGGNGYYGPGTSGQDSHITVSYGGCGGGGAGSAGSGIGSGGGGGGGGTLGTGGQETHIGSARGGNGGGIGGGTGQCHTNLPRTGYYGGSQGLKGGNGTVYKASGATITGNAASIQTAPNIITYSANGDNVSGMPANQDKFNNIAEYITHVTPTRTGHTFIGWNMSSTATTASHVANTVYSTNASLTLYAIWEADNYTVSYNANGGEGAPETQIKTFDIDLTLSDKIPTRNDYVFAGWNTDADGTGTDYKPGDIYSIDANVTLYAQWVRRAFIVNDQSDNFYISGSGSAELFKSLGIGEEDSAVITLTVEDADGQADGADEILFEVKGRTIQFFDITVTQQINGGLEEPLTELPVPIQVVIDLSPELSGKPGYSVYRYHDNAAELLGMDNTDGEYYTVSRGTGVGGVDQIVIYTKKFSTYAVVEHIVSLGGSDYEGFEEDSDEFEVQARIIDGTPAVYHIDIEWGDMKFEYYPEEFIGIWNTETSTYEGAREQGWHGMDGENNKITVTNRSNADVTVNIEVTENLFDNLQGADVEMNVYTTEEFTEEFSDEQEKRHLGKVPAQGADALSVDAFLRIDGEPVEPNTSDPNHDNHPAEQFHRVGTITVTITPDGDSTLTPR